MNGGSSDLPEGFRVDEPTSACEAESLTFEGILREAGVDPRQVSPQFLKDSRGTLDSLNGWLCRRYMEQGKHLGPEGKPYKQLTGKRKGLDQPLARSNGGSG